MKSNTFIFAIGLILALSFSSFSQEKLLTMDDVTSNYLLYPHYYRIIKEMKQLQWQEGEDAYTFIKDDILYQGSVKKNKNKDILDLEKINKSLEKLEKTKLKRFPYIHWISGNEFRFQHEDEILIYNLKNNNITVGNCCDTKGENSDFCKSNFAIAYTVANNLYISEANEKGYKVTDDETFVDGQSVHRREFGITKGTFWSPKGNYLAFYRKDENMVSDYPIIDFDERVAENKAVKYPMAGMKSEEVQLGIYSLKDKKTIYLKTKGDKEKYLTNITWGPNENFIYIAELNRDQNHLKLNKYDAKTGELVKTLFEEKSKKYVEPEHGLYFLKTKPDQFIWFSERNNYNHLYLYNTDGEMIEQITEGEYDVLEFIGFDETEENVIYRAVDEDYPLQKHIYSINLKTMRVIKLTMDEGVHTCQLSYNGKYLLDIYSSSTVAHKINLVDINGMLIRTIYNDYNSLKDYKLGNITAGKIKADDGVNLYYRMIKPIDFDATKKYPVIVYVYGGPHAQMIENSWGYGASLWMRYMAQKGFVVFTLDNHGSPNRGLAFEQKVFRKLGNHEIADQMKGIEFLKTKSFVDADRIGVHGWSYGGYMTISLMLKQADVFKVGVAGAPVIDWSLYEVMYGERYMDTPEKNPEGYKQENLLNYVKNLKGDLLVIHGTSDETVVWQQTIQFVKACINEGIQFDYFVYPGQKHGIRGKARHHLNTMMTNYFLENL